MARLLEALEAGDWDIGDGDADVDADLEELGLGDEHEEDEIVGGNEGTESEMRQPMIRPREADRDQEETTGEDEGQKDAEVEELHRMMLKMQAAKGMFSPTQSCTNGRSEERVC